MSDEEQLELILTRLHIQGDLNGDGARIAQVSVAKQGILHWHQQELERAVAEALDRLEKTRELTWSEMEFSYIGSYDDAFDQGTEKQHDEFLRAIQAERDRLTNKKEGK